MFPTSKYTHEEGFYVTKLWKEANSICFLSNNSTKAAGKVGKKKSPPHEEVITHELLFPKSGILRVSRCGPVKRQEVNALHFCLKHTLLFSDFTIVPGKIKRALSMCFCVLPAFMSYLITGKLFFDWAEVWAESGQTMEQDDFPRNTKRRKQRRALKSPLEMPNPHTLPWPTGSRVTVRLKVKICNSSDQTQLTSTDAHVSVGKRQKNGDDVSFSESSFKPLLIQRGRRI